MRVFVAGESGAIGRQMVPQLPAEEREVVAGTWISSGIAEIHAWGAGAVVMDGLDPVSVETTAVVSMMIQARGSSNRKTKAVLGWTLRQVSRREDFRSRVTEAQTSNRREAA